MAKRKKKTKPTLVVEPRRSLWFSSKKYGWGWAPASWEGWVVLGTYLIVIVLNFFRINGQTHSVSDTLISFIPETSVLTFFLTYICIKTGEEPRWRWGGKDRGD